jgi:hypothetical protein
VAAVELEVNMLSKQPMTSLVVLVMHLPLGQESQEQLAVGLLVVILHGGQTSLWQKEELGVNLTKLDMRLAQGQLVAE